MKSTPTLAYILDTRSIDADGYGTIKVRVTHERIQRKYSTGYRIHKSIWEKFQRSIVDNALSGKIKDEKVIAMYNTLYIDEKSFLNLSKRILEHISGNFSFDLFKYYYDNPEKLTQTVSSQKPNDIIAALKQKEAELRKADRLGNADNYQSATSSIVRFIKSLDKNKKIEFGITTKSENIILPFESLTPQFLENYEKWMLKYGKVNQSKSKLPTPATYTTISMYLRCVRAIYNIAITDRIVKEEHYPFHKYTIRSGKKNKLSLDKEEITKILDYRPEPGTMEHRSWALWIFSYLANGMNFSDICSLTFENIDFQNNTIIFIRNKTINTTRKSLKPVTTMLFPQMIEIIEAWGNKSKKKEDYVFPFLNDATTEQRRQDTIKNVIKTTNDYIEKIVKKLGISGHITTYTARHSFATILLRSNAPVALISQLLGHGSIKTTENYLGSFKDDQVKDYLKNLI